MNSNGDIRRLTEDNRDEILAGIRKGTEVLLSEKQATELAALGETERQKAYRELLAVQQRMIPRPMGPKGNDFKKLKRWGVRA